VSGNAVTLSWAAPDTGGAPATYVLAAGSAAGWSDPNGTYFARASAQNTGGMSPASNEVTFTVPRACGDAPEAPSNLQSSVSGLAVTLTWVGPGSGAAVTGYVIEAGTSPGLSNIAVVNTGSTATSFTASAVPGTYFVRVRAAGSCGSSPASGDVGVVVR
jgi:hypothetical protein